MHRNIVRMFPLLGGSLLFRQSLFLKTSRADKRIIFILSFINRGILRLEFISMGMIKKLRQDTEASAKHGRTR